MLQQNNQQEPLYIIKSKERCISLGMNPNEIKRPKNIMSELKLEEKKDAYKEILEVVEFFGNKIIKSLEGTPILILISDENGFVLNTLGDESIKSTVAQLGIKAGIQFSEEDMGTNVVSLTLKQNHPVQLIGTNHFHTYLYNSACYGVPFHYTDVNNLLGSICIMTAVILQNSFFLMTLTTVVDAIERELLLRRQNKIIVQQKKQIEEQNSRLTTQKKELEAIIENIDLPVVRLSCPDLKIVDMNKKAFSIIKLISPNVKSIKQIKDNEATDLFEILKTNGYYQRINEVIKEKKTKYLNKESHLINGKEMYWNAIFEPILDLNGEIKEILILIIDVTTEIESNIVMEKTLKLQGEFFTNISHELKTPLNVIFGAVQLFNMYCSNGSLDEKKDSIIKYIESIKQNCYRLSKLINNIVDSSKIQAGFFELNLSNNNIVELVEEIVTSVTTFTESKGINIVFDTEIEEKIIACDPEKLERIVLNLISNAIKFSEVGDEIFVDIKDKNEFVEISVKDNGIGIEAKNLNMIFDRFKQVDESLSRNAEGTGIGLSLVKSIVELHGGSINVESEFGKGSKFIVLLPSREVFHENTLYSSKVKGVNESIRVELSDVYV